MDDILQDEGNKWNSEKIKDLLGMKVKERNWLLEEAKREREQSGKLDSNNLVHGCCCCSFQFSHFPLVESFYH